jgi:hypothetical protein
VEGVKLELWIVEEQNTIKQYDMIFLVIHNAQNDDCNTTQCTYLSIIENHHPKNPKSPVFCAVLCKILQSRQFYQGKEGPGE